jgi:uncharacterized OB-fold protein
MTPTIFDYMSGLNKGNILGSKCKKCGHLMIPLKPVCSNCGSFDMEIFETKGEGILKNFTIIYVAPEKFKDEVPYIVALVNLNEGGTIMARLVGVDPNKPEEIKIGTRVKCKFLMEKPIKNCIFFEKKR